MKSMRQQLRSGLLFFDGTMSMRLMEMGMDPHASPEIMNLVHPEWVYNVHREYLEAGADILRTNTFGVNGWEYSDTGIKYQRLIREGIQIARRAAAHASTEEKPRYVAFDVGPSGAKPMEEAITYFAEMAQIAEEEGANVIFFEGFQDLYEMKAAVLAAKENTSLPIFATMARNSERDPACFAALMEGLRVDAIGLQGGTSSKEILPLVRELAARCSIPIIAISNTRLHSSAEEFALDMKALIEAGVHLAGGSRGTTPAHIRCMSKRCDSLHPAVIQQGEITVASSYAIVQRIGDANSGSLMVGERINPTGKKRLQQALHDHDWSYVQQEAMAQRDTGAQLLDVNVGMPGIDERQTMQEAILAIQQVVALPLLLDSARADVLEGAMRVYNGKPVVNSVNGKQRSMDAVFPLVAKYGGVVVALPLDEAGIPETPEGRLAVAQKIIREAAAYGIEKKDIIVDPMVLAVSTVARGAVTALESLRLIKTTLQVPTILGISNVSYGFPARANLNAAFYTMALQAGVDMAILDTGSESVRGAWDAYQALSGLDENGLRYIGRYKKSQLKRDSETEARKKQYSPPNV